MPLPPQRRPRPQHKGVALFVVIVFVMLSMLLALWASRTSLFNEMLVGNDADYQRAFEAAQSLLQDAELDIRGENPDGSVCVTADKCRNYTVGKYQIPVDAQAVTPLLAQLDTQPTKCLHGLCTKRSGRQDFWNYTSVTSPAPTNLQPGEVKLEDMTKPNVGARYGEYTNATLGDKDHPANPLLQWSNDPLNPTPDNQGGWYWIEVLRYDESSKNSGLIVGGANTDNLLRLNLTPNVVYRITALAYGRKPGTMAVLQQTYARQIHKD
ncbi:MAG: pilus assembly protein [Gammaproteobacteria bacterium]|nr:pilus assembly protein [Gammaproteobacteria bacterium]